MSDLEGTPKVSHGKHLAPDKDGKSGRKAPKSHQEKGLYQLSIFVAAVVTGTGCSIFNKMIYGIKGVGTNGELQCFDKPLFQTLTMFGAMILGVPFHCIVVYFEIPFPGYHDQDDDEPVINLVTDERTQLLNSLPQNGKVEPKLNSYGPPLANDDTASLGDSKDDSSSHDLMVNSFSLPMKTYLILALLSVFDLMATCLCGIGLLYLDVSVYQMLRGSSILFVALLRQYGLRQHLYRFQWVGVFYNALSVVLVGTAALRDASSTEDQELANKKWGDALLGVMFMLAGTLVQAMQFVLEEKIMCHDDVKVPPLLLFGMEGVWGSLFSVCLLLPIGYMLPGKDNGHYEDPFNAMTMLWNTGSIQICMICYLLCIFGYNLLAVLVTFSLSSVWHSILDNFRPMTVWVTDLIVYYTMEDQGFGEAWTNNSWIQLAGLGVLLYGTVIYNAPDSGSIKLQGQWYALWLNFQQDYSDLESESEGRSSMGSYPSLQRFISGSLRVSDNRRLEHDLAVAMSLASTDTHV